MKSEALHSSGSSLVECLVDPSVHRGALAVDALGVHPEQDVYAVPGPAGDLGRWDARVESERHGRVPA